MGKVLISHITSYAKYQTKSVIKFLFRQFMMSYALRFFLDQPLKVMADREKKTGRRKYKKLNISRTKRAF